MTQTLQVAARLWSAVLVAVGKTCYVFLLKTQQMATDDDDGLNNFSDLGRLLLLVGIRVLHACTGWLWNFAKLVTSSLSAQQHTFWQFHEFVGTKLRLMSFTNAGLMQL